MFDINHYYYSCDDISEFPAVEEIISEENRTLLSNILGQDAMKNFIQNYNDVKNANEKLRGRVSEALKTGDVNVNTGDVNMNTGDVNMNMDVDSGDVNVKTGDMNMNMNMNMDVDTGDVETRKPEYMDPINGGTRKKRRRRNKSNKK